MNKALKQISIIFLLLTPLIFAELPLGKIPPLIELNGKLGSRTDGSAWSSASIKDKLMMLYYIDPDEKKMNQHVYDTLTALKLPPDSVGSVAALNLKATWIPNAILETMIARKQKQYPRTVYVYDQKQVFMKKWGMKNNSSSVILFNTLGEVIFFRDGKVSETDLTNLLKIIFKELGRN